MRLIIDTNVVLAYLISGSARSSNAKVCRRVVNGLDKAFTCDILYGELKRLLDLDPDLIEKISIIGKKEGDVFRALYNAKTEYLNSRLDPYVMQLNFVKTENLAIDPVAIKDIGNDWYMISIAKSVSIDYIVTWNTQDVLKYADRNGIDVNRILEPPKYLELIK
ncbi:TVG0144477 [Thermoplasma volcanium GSS1]|uniref:TVG0144477 protein n=1 Tax=Thermoplasma volcanium (strain ATCC 51530 / DSM 4299 / JCM 9571 / NBRC 15438 / GSS1) TaxID=273116 RepID=Q97CG4_THEVO|nr:PIN domain-containing protein [Thermoplasma volcanium]BAB59279.1 TVG0144477 [Thermoplasma volcanium GSS1]